jgi:hypothetical protein
MPLLFGLPKRHATVPLHLSARSQALLDVVKGIGEAIKSLQNIPSMYDSRFIEYASQEVRKGRPSSEVLTEFDPSLATLFKSIIDAANSRISEVIRMGKPPRIALNDYYPGLDYLFDMAISRVTSDKSDAVLQALQAQIEKLVSLIIRVQVVTTFGMESTNGTLEAIQARKKEIETINKTVVENNTTLSENACALIADQAKQLDGFLVFTETETKRIGSLMDQLYASVSNFRLPQRVYGVATPRSQ